MKLFKYLSLVFALYAGSTVAYGGLDDVREALKSGRLEEGKYRLLELVREKNIEALRLYAGFLIKGEYFARNVNTAVVVLDQAARLGDDVSRETLIKMYERGRFVRKSQDRAEYYANLGTYDELPLVASEGSPPDSPEPEESTDNPPQKNKKKNVPQPFGSPVRPSWGSDSAPSVAPKASGSGFAATRNGYIITNEHVVSECSKVYVIYQDRLKRATVLLEDKKADVSVLKINGDTPAYIKGSSAKLRLGAQVLAAGFPLQEMLGSTIKITDGIISSDLVSQGMFQHSAPTQPGNSGGPLINRSGEVVGIVTAVLLPGEGYNPQNVNFAVPVSVIQQTLNHVNVPWELLNSDVELDTVSLAAGLKKAAVNILCF